ncbi:MAG: hypothetical protein ABI216_06180, partial [Devosia sp.]
APGSTQLPGQLAIARSYANQSKALERRESFKFNQEQNTTLALLQAAGMANYYWFHFNREGVAEAEIEQNIESAIRRILFSLSGDMPSEAGFSLTLSGAGGFLEKTKDPEHLPEWLSAADVEVYASAFRKHGMRGPFNWYRNIDRNWATMAPFQGAKVTPPALFICGT